MNTAPLFKTTLQLVTPCFCAGAEQTEAELRAPSFRGELRWWFRCLGGTLAEENEIFGNAAGRTGLASRVALHVTELDEGLAKVPFQWKFESPHGKNVEGPPPPPNSAYITWFLEKRSSAYLPPGRRFTLELRELRPLAPDARRDLLELAWRCMCFLGAVGARKTRALGAYSPVDPKERHEVEALLQNPTVRKYFAFTMKPVEISGDFRSPETTTKLLTEAARRVARYRSDNGLPARGANNPAGCISVLGHAMKNSRQASAVRLRPVLDAEDKLLLYIMKAPASTLCAEARRHDITL